MSKVRPLKVGITCNIKTDKHNEKQAEFDEPSTIEALSDALTAGGYQPIVLEASESLPEKLMKEKPDIVFNIAENSKGRCREAQVPAILAYFDIPFTGSDATTMAVALDKALTKRLVQSWGVKTPQFAVYQPNSAVAPPKSLPFPLIVKPNQEGSSKGIDDHCVAENYNQLLDLLERNNKTNNYELLLEEYIDGREFTVGLLGNQPDLVVLEPMEIVFNKIRGDYPIYSYQVKRNYQQYVAYCCPAEIELSQKQQMIKEALTVYEALGCRDFARIDFRLSKQGELFFIEVNPLPGLAPGYSDLAIMAEFSGISYNQLICDLLGYGLKRNGMEPVKNDE